MSKLVMTLGPRSFLSSILLVSGSSTFAEVMADLAHRLTEPLGTVQGVWVCVGLGGWVRTCVYVCGCVRE